MSVNATIIYINKNNSNIKGFEFHQADVINHNASLDFYNQYNASAPIHYILDLNVGDVIKFQTDHNRDGSSDNASLTNFNFILELIDPD